MVRNRSKKAFTLIEMVIAMVVIVIVFGMVMLMSVSISAFNREKTYITTCHEEVANAQQFINNWAKSLDDAFNTNYKLQADGGISVSSGLYWFEDEDNSFKLRFEPSTKTLSGDFYINGKPMHKEETFTALSGISFSQGGGDIVNAVKCVITLTDNTSYTMLLQKESSKPGMDVIFNKPVERVNGSDNEFIFITSADWDEDLAADGYEDLQDLSKLAAYDFSSAYQYSALSMLRVQVDHQNRMSLEAFTSAYGAKWKVRLFNAAGKIAYGMKLPASQFNASQHRLSFFIEDGSVLYDGTPVEPMGYTRKAGAIGTTDWHTAAVLTFDKSVIEGSLLYFNFNTNIYWDELDASSYEQVQYYNLRRLYGLSDAFGAGIENGIFVAMDAKSKCLGDYRDDDIYVSFDNKGPKGTVRVRIGLNAGNLGYFDDREVIFTFTTLVSLPDGTPLREEQSFRCGDIYTADTLKSATVSAAGEWFEGDSGVASGDPLLSRLTFNMGFYIHAPWTDANRTSYIDLQNTASAKSTYGLTDEFLNNLYDRIFIGRDGVEIPLRKAINELKFKISLQAAGERTLLILTVNTADMRASSYPLKLQEQVFSIRFGDIVKSGSDRLVKTFCLPNGTPVRAITLARPVAEYGKAPWLTRHTLSSKVNSSQSGSTLYIDFTSNGPWLLSGTHYYNVLTDVNNMGFSTAFVNSLKNKLVLKIGETEKTLDQWGIKNFDAVVFERDGRWALQLQIKNNLTAGKQLVIKFTEGFVGPDGTTLVVPINFVREGTNSWTGSTDPGLFFPNRTVSILNSTGAIPSYSVSVQSGSYSGTAPFYIYGRVKLENSAAIDPSKYAGASIVLDYASSADITLATLDTDTNGWIALSELYGGTITLKKENAKITVKMDNMSGKVSLANLIIADKNGNIKYSMANDTTLYGVGDVRNVNNIHSSSTWSVNKSGDASFPIITKGDSYYTPSRVLSMTINSGYDGGDASFIISQNAFTRGITYYITGRIRTSIAGMATGGNVVVNGAGDSKYYGTKDGDWVALANPDGSALSFKVEESPKTLSTPTRKIGMGSHLNTQNAKMVIDCDDFNLNYTPGLYVVRGFYKVTSYDPNLNATSHRYTIGGNAEDGKIESTGNQTTWKYFRLVWDSRKGNNLDFEFMNANGFMYLADVTIENSAGTVVYDMSLDTELAAGWYTSFPRDPSIWYFTRFGEHSGDAMDLSIDKVGSATPLQYTFSRTTTAKTLANGSESRTLSIHSKYGTTNGKITLDAGQFKSKTGLSGTFTVRGFYKIEGFTNITGDGKYEIGDGASKGIETGSSNVTTWNYFELTWNTSTHLNFEFHGAMGYIRLANVTIEDAKYKVVYDMATDTALTESYRTGFPWNPSIWYITYFGEPSTVMDASISAVSTGTPMQYKSTIASANIKRSMGIGSSGNTINAKMLVYGSKFASKYGAGTYTVSGYYSITSFNALDSAADCIIGTGATSGAVHNKAKTNGWTYFTLQWNTSQNLVFEFWHATGYMYLGNLTFIDSSGNIDYDLSTDTSLPTGWQTAFPQEPNFWYWGYSGAMSYVDMAIDPATGSSPSRNADGHTETPISTIADSQVKRSVSIGSQNYLQSAKMVITAAQGTAKFGANKTMIVRGYYKVTSYKANGSNPWWQIGSNADSGQSGQLTGNQSTWKYFKIYWNTSKDLNFELWHCEGYMRLANVTIEDLNGGVRYDMSTDSALSEAYLKTFPVQKSIWYFTNEGNINFMDSVVTKVGSSTPKQYTASAITETAKALTTPNRTIGFGAKHKLQNGKMIITTEQATAKFGANKDMIVRGYYKVTGYTKIADNDWYGIGSNAASGGIKSTGNQTTWKYFKLHWNTSKDLNFEFWNANGFMYLANVTIEYAASGYINDVAYDLSTDTNLYKDGAYYIGLESFPRSPSIWYFSAGSQVVMDMIIDDPGVSTPVQYSYDWDYLKFSMWESTGTMEIADLTIYHISSVTGQKVIDYSMATDSLFNSTQTKVNANGAIASGSKWMSWEWKKGSAGKFTYQIINYNNTAHPDTDFIVPKFQESAG